MASGSSGSGWRTIQKKRRPENFWELESDEIQFIQEVPKAATQNKDLKLASRTSETRTGDAQTEDCVVISKSSTYEDVLKAIQLLKTPERKKYKLGPENLLKEESNAENLMKVW